ncbi:MAG: GGDEF domain-containing phosphodiesterase, partial [Pseudomonadota bacterium]
KPMNINGKNYHITPSIGISLYPQDTDSIEMLIRNADSAMFKVKEQGRNSFQFYTEELTQLALKRVEIENGMRNALIKKHFVVWYQPQYEIASGKLVGMEALVRWQDPQRGIIPPNDFIPLAEESGLIIELGKQVIDQVMRQTVIWHNNNLEPGRIAINLSGKQLFSGDITSDIKQLLEKNQCRIEWIDLEVTEGFFMSKSDNAIKRLHELHNMGFNIALDDFGTGYSSLAHLKHLPISKLKIDHSFVKDLPYDRDDIGISRAVIALADGLNLDVIAEGVETTEQAEFLLQQGCPLAQGYLYSKPLPAEEISQLLQLNKSHANEF